MNIMDQPDGISTVSKVGNVGGGVMSDVERLHGMKRGRWIGRINTVTREGVRLMISVRLKEH